MSLRTQLIRLAHEQPAFRAQLLSLIHGGNSQQKVAVAEETSDFVEWVINTQNPISENRVEAFLTTTLNMTIQPPITKRPGPRFIIGDRVIVRKDKHKDPQTLTPYVDSDGKVGVVVDVVGLDVLVQLDTGPKAPVRFPGALQPRGVGLMKYTPPFTLTGSAKIEMIYFANPEATVKDEQQLAVTQYLGRARKGEQRSATYYTGHLFSARTNASGEVYFQAFPQQRQQIDPNSEGGYQVRSFNPTKGKVLYMGLVGKRPANWKAELKRLREIAAGE